MLSNPKKLASGIAIVLLLFAVELFFFSIGLWAHMFDVPLVLSIHFVTLAGSIALVALTNKIKYENREAAINSVLIPLSFVVATLGIGISILNLIRFF